MTYMSTFCAGVAGANYVQSTKGWERVTSISELQTNPEDYFFAIFSANAPKLMVRTQTSDGQGYYISASDPLSSSEYLFGLENYSYSGDSYFVMKAQNTNAYYYPLWDHAYDLFAPSSGKVAADDACRLTFSYSDGAWDIKTWAEYDYGSNWGIWDYGHGYLTEEKMAGNRTDAQKGSFLIYRIAKENLNMTSRIVNPKAETNTDGWTGFDGNVTKRNTGSGFDGKEGFFELCDWGYTWDLTVSQSVNNLPNGYYMVQAAGQLSDRGTTMTLTVNGESRNFEAHGTSSGNILADGTQTYAGGGVAGWRYNSVVAQVTDGTLTITVHGVATEVNRWANFDNVTLTYVGSSLPESLSSVSGKMNADVATAQTNAVNTYESSKTAANLNSALRAIAAAEVSKAAYANAAVYFSNVEALLATTNFYTSDAYNSVYDTYKSAYDAGTLDDATAAGLTYKVASWEGTQKYDTNTANDLLIPGWTIGSVDAATNHTALYINTWSHEDDGKGFDNPFYEYWVENGSLPERTLAGTISGLTANATYAVTANVRVQGDDKVENSIRMQVGSGTTVDVTQGNKIDGQPRYVKSYTAVGTADASGNLTLTFTVDPESKISWLSFRDVRYEKLPSVTVSAKAGKYGTVILPFAYKFAEDDDFSDIKFYSCASVNNSYTQIEEVPTPLANTPYIIKNNGVSDFSKTISGFSVAEEDSYTDGLLTGVYTNAYIPMSDGSNSYYVLQTKGEVQAFYKVEDADFPGTPYKCYLTIPAATPVKAFLFPENPTAINAIETAENENTEIYNLAGQRLSKVQKGVNIINGKKVLVK